MRSLLRLRCSRSSFERIWVVGRTILYRSNTRPSLHHDTDVRVQVERDCVFKVPTDSLARELDVSFVTACPPTLLGVSCRVNDGLAEHFDKGSCSLAHLHDVLDAMRLMYGGERGRNGTPVLLKHRRTNDHELLLFLDRNVRGRTILYKIQSSSYRGSVWVRVVCAVATSHPVTSSFTSRISFKSLYFSLLFLSA